MTTGWCWNLKKITISQLWVLFICTNTNCFKNQTSFSCTKYYPCYLLKLSALIYHKGCLTEFPAFVFQRQWAGWDAVWYRRWSQDQHRRRSNSDCGKRYKVHLSMWTCSCVKEVNNLNCWYWNRVLMSLNFSENTSGTNVRIAYDMKSQKAAWLFRQSCFI